jgi:hypothetical protein
MEVENQFNKEAFEMFENEMQLVPGEEHRPLNSLIICFTAFADLVMFEPRARSGRNMMLLAARALACAKAIALGEKYGEGFHVSVCGVAALILDEQGERLPETVELSEPLQGSMMAAKEGLTKIMNKSSTVAERIAAHRAAADFAVDIAECVDQAYKRRNRSVA